jgi:hypothetical protein
LGRGRNGIDESSLVFTIVVEYDLFETIITDVCKFTRAVRKAVDIGLGSAGYIASNK